ncbi:MAG: thioredoxin [Lachnospiraceae bacterium]|nr:thioredoxin [Lachnospiraceae bacterium]
MSEIVLTNQNFEEEVTQSDIPVLVDFWAVWCGPCKMLAPIVEEIAREFEGKVKVGKVNVDDEPALAARFGISSIPTLILFKDGQQAAVSVGVRPKEELVQMLQ